MGYFTNERIIANGNKILGYTLCPQGTFLEKGGESNCKKCHDYGVCEGGYGFNYPKKKYWRISNKSLDYIFCNKDPSLCLGNDTCKEGYAGVIC